MKKLIEFVSESVLKKNWCKAANRNKNFRIN
jgi:hypothetical protein